MADKISDEAVQRLAQAIDRLAGEFAGVAAYVAHLPGASAVDVDSVRTLAQQLASNATANRGTAPIQQAIFVVDRIHAAVAKLATSQSREQ